MYCKKYGNEINEYDRHCPKCGCEQINNSGEVLNTVTHHDDIQDKGGFYGDY